ncbi:MAG TPA: tetratricopeptide repeat protein [Chthoniobacteraceae bacterium]
MRTRLRFLLVVCTGGVLAFASAMRATPEAAERLASDAQDAFVAQDFPKALALLTKAIAENPSDYTLYGNRGSCYDNLGQTTEALHDFDTSLQKAIERTKDPKDQRLAPILFNRGQLYVHAGLSKEAIADFEKTLAIDDDFPNARLELSWTLATSVDPAVRNPKKALELVLEDIKRNGANGANSADTLAAAQAVNGNFTEAVKQEKDALSQARNILEKKNYTERLRLYEAGKPYLQKSEK